MKIKQYFKRIKIIYEINALIKSIQLKNESKAIEKKYKKYYQSSDFKYVESKVKEEFQKRVRQRKPELKTKKLNIVWIGANKQQDYSGFIQGLRQFGSIYEYVDCEGKYKLRSQSSRFNRELIKQNDEQLLNFIDNLFQQGIAVDILMGQFWGNSFSVETLKKIQSMNIININISMDDRLPSLWTKKNGIYPGVVELVDGLDLVLTTSPECCERYFYHGCPSLYWPLGSDSELFKPHKIKDIDVSFIGNRYGIREKIVQGLVKKGINVSAYGKGWENGSVGPKESSDIFGRSKIILGIGTIAYNHDMYTLKLRDFDATMAGALYITHRNPDLSKLFEEHVEVEYYDDIDEAARKIKYYLSQPDLLERVANNGYRKAKDKYTWKRRLQEVFELINI